MKLINSLLETINTEYLLRHNAPAKLRWLTFWPTIKSNKDRTKIILPVAPIVLGIFVVLVLLSVYLWKNRTNTLKEQENILRVIGKTIELPVETPQIAIVSDADVLNQPFFANAENGDYVIVYPETGKVLLYRPATKKVINFANIQIPLSPTETFELNN
jgi:hypothetical protein